MDETDYGPDIPSTHDFQVLGRAAYGQHDEKAQPILLHTLASVLYHGGLGPFHQ